MPAWVVEGVNEYTRRFPPDCKLHFVEIAPLKRGKTSNIEKVTFEEGQKVLAAIPKGNRIIALEVDGKPWDTPALAKQLESWKMDGRDVSLMIGGPEGLSSECKAAAQQKWSLSALTLPHPMVRIIVAEALYRAWTVTQNHPYHRE